MALRYNLTMKINIFINNMLGPILNTRITVSLHYAEKEDEVIC